ncbi:MAG: hypothetical protein P1U68_09220 [Verrucomicrobiales bacterium]|nr:hypothetical protein [Verrucomicrobiales bacterium]
MKPESLDALMIDHALGELPREVAELLDAYLLENPEESSRASLLREAIGATDSVVQRRPDLFRETGESRIEKGFMLSLFSRMQTVAVAAFICLAGVAGFFLKSEMAKQQGEIQSPALLATTRESPWARYHIEDSVGEPERIFPVRVESQH